MNIDLTHTLTAPEGTPIKLNGQEQTKLGEALIAAYMSVISGDDRMTLDQKVKSHKVLTTLSSAKDEIELTPEELTAIRKRVSEAFHFVVAGTILELLG